MSKEREDKLQDLATYGVSFSKGGKRIDPRDVYISTEPEQEPVAWKVIDGTNGKYMFSRIKPTERSYKYDVVIPLYASPQTRKFLSVKQAKDLWETTFKSAVPYYTFYEICVAIEQYQDIGVDDE
jgi:hypothetical protein